MCRDRRAAKPQVFAEFQWPQEGVGQPLAPRAPGARGLQMWAALQWRVGQPRFGTRCVCCLPDHTFTLPPPLAACGAKRSDEP